MREGDHGIKVRYRTKDIVKGQPYIEINVHKLNELRCGHLHIPGQHSVSISQYSMSHAHAVVFHCVMQGSGSSAI